MAKLRYTLVRVFTDIKHNFRYDIEEIDCKTKKEAIDLGSILTKEEKILSYIMDNVRNEKLTLNGE